MSTRQLATWAAGSGILAGFLGITLATLMLFHEGEPPTALFVTLLVGAIVSALGMMVFLGLYMYFDARSRGMNGALSALLLFLVGPPGLVIYLLIRTPRVQRSP